MKKTLDTVQFSLPLEIKQDEDGVCIAECPMIQGCRADGLTRKEALHNIAEVIELCLVVRQELAEKGLKNLKKQTQKIHGQPA